MLGVLALEPEHLFYCQLCDPGQGMALTAMVSDSGNLRRWLGAGIKTKIIKVSNSVLGTL